MNNYRIVRKLGEGSFGVVLQGMDRRSDEFVAIKMLKTKYVSWQQCLNLNEVKSLVSMNHPNIVRLKHVFMERGTFYMVFEYLDNNLLQVMENRRGIVFGEAQIRDWCFQLFQALAHMHERGYFHRDLKPENLLLKNGKIKIADLGMVKEICSQPPYTEYVTTRWYRAPEVILKSPVYGSAVDMWAMGAIMAEMFTLAPLFPGSSEADEVYKICSILGSPNVGSWAEGLQLANELNFQFPRFDGIPLPLIMPSASEEARSLIGLLCSWDPSKRPTAAETLRHPFFRSCYADPIYVPPPLRLIRSFGPIARPSAATRKMLEDSNCPGYRNSGALPDSMIGGVISSMKSITLK